jgi:hypothetical protein
MIDSFDANGSPVSRETESDGFSVPQEFTEAILGLPERGVIRGEPVLMPIPQDPELDRLRAALAELQRQGTAEEHARLVGMARKAHEEIRRLRGERDDALRQRDEAVKAAEGLREALRRAIEDFRAAGWTRQRLALEGHFSSALSPEETPRPACSTPTLRPPARNGDESAYDHDAPEFCVCGVRMDAHRAPAAPSETAPARMVTTHYLKTWPEYFAAILDGRKTFEIRRDDRGFDVGDVLHLAEWDPERALNSGRELRVRVTYYVGRGAWGLPAGLCVMGIARPPAPAPDAPPEVGVCDEHPAYMGGRRFPHWKSPECVGWRSVGTLAPPAPAASPPPAARRDEGLLSTLTEAMTQARLASSHLHTVAFTHVEGDAFVLSVTYRGNRT